MGVLAFAGKEQEGLRKVVLQFFHLIPETEASRRGKAFNRGV